ncbi:MAG: hypothetical protein HC810_06670 [Acaryochloridaceae cyanobacterium RL_2_7]|nr:hypothetical protein [Acaryochloridaceae cyanobacterium RL_2_7]
MTINPSGTVQSVTPLNDLATQNSARAKLPAQGQTLTSPFAGNQSQTYDVKLYPDGSVAIKLLN